MDEEPTSFRTEMTEGFKGMVIANTEALVSIRLARSGGRMARCRCLIPPSDRCPNVVPLDQPFCDDCLSHAEDGRHANPATAVRPGDD
jgi:hypothetical protein